MKSKMRKLGDTLKNQGFFEIDFIDGHINWVNQFALSKMGYQLNQIITMSIFDIVPGEFHEHVRNYMSDRHNDGGSYYELWPFWSSDREIVWWYAVETGHEDPCIWLKGDYLDKTPQIGSKTNLMAITMNTVQSYNDLVLKIEKQEERIDQLEHDNTDHSSTLKSIGGRLERIENIARSAADTAFAVSEELKSIKTYFNISLEEQTAEILRLIMTDSVHDERMKNFNSNLQESAAKAVDAAIAKITEQSEEAGQQMVQKVDEAGNKASKRITIPLGLVMFLIALIQIAIQIWHH
jgi:hypothetical protein